MASASDINRQTTRLNQQHKEKQQQQQQQRHDYNNIH
jgi:hypothetical protein